MFRIIFSIALIAHGIGHVIGVSAAWTPVKMGFSNHPWIFSKGVNITSGIGRNFGVVWLAALIFSIAAGVALILRLEGWTALAILGACISSVALFIWWRAFPSGSNVSALVFNLLILAALLGPWSSKAVEALQ
ncbi:hypothetical protein ACFLYP_00125 [Chloroflexota bacterium]